jgi:hypothetical protein
MRDLCPGVLRKAYCWTSITLNNPNSGLLILKETPSIKSFSFVNVKKMRESPKNKVGLTRS